jgi:hypothetical protein
VPSGYQWKDGDPGFASNIFLWLLKDHMTDRTTILQELEKQVENHCPQSGKAFLSVSSVKA